MKTLFMFNSSLIRNSKGLTLIEILIAVVILSIGLLGVALMQYMAVAGNAYGREMQIATELAQEQLEIFKTTDYVSVITGNDPPLTDPEPSRFGGNTFTRVWWVADNCRNIGVALDPNNPCNVGSATNCTAAMNDTKAIAVRVCWVDQYGGNHSVTINGVKWNEEAIP